MRLGRKSSINVSTPIRNVGSRKSGLVDSGQWLVVSGQFVARISEARTFTVLCGTSEIEKVSHGFTSIVRDGQYSFDIWF